MRRFDRLRGDSARLLYGSLIVGLILAAMTGKSGSVGAPTSGLHASILNVRVVFFLLLGVVIWAVLLASRAGNLKVATGRTQLGARVSAVTSRKVVSYPLQLGLLAVAAVLPMFFSPTWQQALVDQIGIYVLLSLGLNVVVGFAGLLDLGFVAFFAIGAYVTAYFTGALPSQPPFEVTPLLCFPIAFVAAMIAGVILGTPTLRLRGDYLAIVTLGFGEIIYTVANNLTSITGGPQGVGDPHGKSSVPHFVFGSYHWSLTNLPYYYLLLGILAVTVVALRRLEHSRVGRAWTAIREDEVAAEATGIPALKLKVMAFAIGASTSGFAGTLFASKTGFFNPGVFTVQISILILVLVIFGGMGSIWGAIIGAGVLQAIPVFIRLHLPNLLPPEDIYMYVGFILIVMMIFRPQGLIPSRRRARELHLTEEGAGTADAMAAPGSAP